MTRSFEDIVASDCFAGRIRILNRLVSGIYDGKLRAHGIRSSQINILVVIATQGPLQASEICRRLCLEKSTLSRDLERLVAHQWVNVAPATGRVRLLQITDAGRQVIRALRPAWEEAQAETRKLLGDVLSNELFRVVDRSVCSRDVESAIDPEVSRRKSVVPRAAVNKGLR
ncbi:MAG TPA: MarR family transcriptional regulator [Schlesneria sp.]|jgi:DNA-binding MarR family transcriptional regulator